MLVIESKPFPWSHVFIGLIYCMAFGAMVLLVGLKASVFIHLANAVLVSIVMGLILGIETKQGNDRIAAIVGVCISFMQWLMPIEDFSIF